MSRQTRRARERERRKGQAGTGADTALVDIGTMRMSVPQALDLGVRHQSEGRLDDAAQVYAQILLADPDQPDALHLMGMVHFQQGRTDEAVRLVRQALERAPKNEFAWCNLGNVLHAAGDIDGAIDATRRAVKINPKYVEAYNNLGNRLMDAGQYASAVAAFEKALRIREDLPAIRNNLALALIEAGRVEDALACIDPLLAAHPDFAEAHNTRGTVLSMMGRLDEAAACFRRAVSLRPGLVEAHWHLARLRTFTEPDGDVKAMEELYRAQGIGPQQRMHLAFSLGKVYEDLKRYDDAFDCLSEANAIKRSMLRFDITDVERAFAETKARFDADFIARFAEAGVSDDRPVFIVGMPRSGTTLIEQALSSHPDVFGAGELSAVGDALADEFGPLRYGNIPDFDERGFEKKLRNAARAYLKVIRGQSRTARRVTDKMPHNFEKIGLIRLMFPNAKVIHCRRDPIDNCFSLFKVHFSAANYNYAYDAAEIAGYYNLYRDLMAHWAEVVPGFVLDVGYEAFTRDQRAETERLLAYCGLEWDEACMAHHENRRNVKTASFAQVRKPVFTTSVGLWENYGGHLRDMIAMLETGK